MMTKITMTDQLADLKFKSDVLRFTKHNLIKELEIELSHAELGLDSNLHAIHKRFNTLDRHVEKFNSKRSETEDVNELIAKELLSISVEAIERYEVVLVEGSPKHQKTIPIQVFEPQLMGYWCHTENCNPTINDILPFFDYDSFHPDYEIDIWEHDVIWKLRQLAEGVALSMYRNYLIGERKALRINHAISYNIDNRGTELRQTVRKELLHLSKPWFECKEPMFDSESFEHLINLTCEMIIHEAVPDIDVQLPRIHGANKNIITVSFERLYFKLTGKTGKGAKRPDYWFEFLWYAFLDFYQEVDPIKTLKNKCTIYQRKLRDNEKRLDLETDIKKLLAQ